jgi:hypothetical protein
MRRVENSNHARENIRHFRNRLRSEVDPAKRSVIQRLLVQEEDKLAATLELIEDVAREIARCLKLVERQRAVVVALERDGHDVTTAVALLDGLNDSVTTHQEYHQRVATRLQQNR